MLWMRRRSSALAAAERGEVAALLHHGLLGADELGELLGEPVADVDLVELHVAERRRASTVSPRASISFDDLVDARRLR